MDQAESIVSMLNSPPLELGMKMMNFCQMGPMDLRQLLYQVLSAILPPQRAVEAPQAQNRWMMELLHVLNYHPGIDRITLQEGIANGSTAVIYQLLSWLLSQMTMLQKRAYLAPFLIDMEIPAELLLEEDMNLLHVQYNDIREQFKATHQHLETLRQVERDPNEIKAQIQDLETEREHLQSKVAKVKWKLQDVEKVETILEVVGKLKSLKVEETTLAQAGKDQNQALTVSQGKYQKALSKLRQMQAHASGANNPALLEKMSQGNNILRYNAEKKLPKEIEKKQLHLRALQEVLANKPDGVAGLQAKLLAVNEEIRLLTKKNGSQKAQQHHKASGGGILAWQEEQMAATFANQLQEAHDDLEALTKRRDQLVDNIHQNNVAIEEVKATVKHGEEFKQYVEQLRMKSATYKMRKKEIDDLAAEYEILLNTQKLLENQLSLAQHAAQDEIILQDQQSSTENLKELIAQVDAVAEETRGKLTFQVNRLKLLQAELHEAELQHVQHKKHYNDMHLSLERKVRNLEGDICCCSEELELETKAMNGTTTAIEKLQRSVLQMTTEKQDGTVSANLISRIAQLEELMTNLHQKLQKLKETEHPNLVQMAMMKDLRTLLAAKLSMYSSGLKPTSLPTANLS